MEIQLKSAFVNFKTLEILLDKCQEVKSFNCFKFVSPEQKTDCNPSTPHLEIFEQLPRQTRSNSISFFYQDAELHLYSQHSDTDNWFHAHTIWSQENFAFFHSSFRFSGNKFCLVWFTWSFNSNRKRVIFSTSSSKSPTDSTLGHHTTSSPLPIIH